MDTCSWTRRDVAFAAGDGTLLRGWHYAPGTAAAPVIVMSHGFGSTKEMGLDEVAGDFAEAGFNCLVYDHRGFGESDGLPRQHADPWQQISDARDAITFARNLPEADGERLGIWGTSYSGGHVLVLGATDRRVRAVVSQGMTVSGWRNSLRRAPGDAWGALSARFAQDRDAGHRGEPLAVIRQIPDVTPEDVDHVPAAGSVEAIGNSGRDWIRSMEPERLRRWENKLTLRSLEIYRSYEPGAFIARIAPTPLLVICPTNDTVTPTDEVLAAYNEAREPKRIAVIPGGHFDLYAAQRGRATAAALAFYKEVL